MAKNKDSQEGTENSKFQSADFKWLCPSCKFLLGFVDQNSETLRMKYKDFYIYVKGGEVTTLCRRCSKVAILSQNIEIDPRTDKPVMVKAVKK